MTKKQISKSTKKTGSRGKVLGRGLGNLLSEDDISATKRKKAGLVDLEVSKIRPNPKNPRKKFDKTSISELAETIKEHGLLQPVTVRAKDGYFELVAGERRLRAVRALKIKKTM